MADDPLDEFAGEVEDLGRRFLKLLYADIRSRDGYMIVLIMVVLTIVMLAVDDSFRAGQIVSAIVIALLVLVTMTRSHVSRRLRLLSGAVTGAAIGISIIAVVSGNIAHTGTSQPHPVWAYALGAISYTIILALCFPAILRRAFAHRQVSLNTVAAALSAYLLLGLIFAGIYRFLQIVAPPFFTQPHVNGFIYTYFSYVTLTTIGYGDFTPANDAGRACAILEGLLGQVFLVTIVALVVTNLGQERQPARVSSPREGETVESSGTSAG